LAHQKQKGGVGMETDDFLRVINEFDFIRDDIDEIKAQVELTKSEDKKMLRAVENIEKAKNILIELFPSIKSLDTDMREDLEGELMDLD
jgi:flagellin-specific chaperone FliS